MKKVAVIILVIIMIAVSVGCKEQVSATVDSNVPVNTKVPVYNDKGFYISSTDDMKNDEVITRGEIVEFDRQYIHIISGDLIQVYEYDNSNMNDFYLGQKVQLIKKDTTNVLENFIVDDFSTHYTNMGDILTKITGKVTDLNDDSITILSEGKNKEFKLYQDQEINISVGQNVTVLYGEFGEKKSVVTIFNEDTKLELTVEKITRGDDGQMLLSLTDKDDGPYIMSLSGVMLELNMSEINVGDILTVHHEGIMESYPMQIIAVLVR